MRTSPPTGTVTFLLTDIESSTQLWQDAPGRMAGDVARHEDLIREHVGAHRGVFLKTRGEGDSTFSVFARASDAAAAALGVQRSLASGSPLRVRVALHTGEAELRDGDYFGAAVARCSRLRDSARGGQTLLSGATAELVRHSMPAGARLEDLGPRRLRDLPGADRVFELCHPDVPRVAVPSSADDAPHNLPVELTTFVGRDAELAEIGRLLDSTRLLTLTGPGGVGKTRLAMRVVTSRVHDFRDGVWIVDVESVTHPNNLAAAVAEAVGMREPGVGGADQVPPVPLLERLTQNLRIRRVLIVLDGCEHVVRACAELAGTLLRVCPSVTLLATSREPLDVPGEARWRVPTLDVPREMVAADDSASVRLFVERARQHQPDFALTASNAPAVVSICRQLDGLPLAIELAAAWIRALEPDEIASRLDDRFRLLAGSGRNDPSRHHALRATVDWSYGLLSDAERRLLSRLWVFVGGFSLEAAERICAGRGAEREDVLALLSRLVDTSLVVKEAYGSASRYRLLETIRQYSREKLDEATTDVAQVAESDASSEQRVFVREGEYWTIGRPGDVVRVRDTKGLGYLHELLSAPGREVHVLDLVGAAFAPDDAPAVIDAEARAAYRARLSELEEELEEARGWNDAGRASKAREEIDRLSQELSAASGLGGRARKLPAAVERARLSATKAIRSAIERVARESPEVGQDLSATIHTGAFCSYVPDARHPLHWTL